MAPEHVTIILSCTAVTVGLVLAAASHGLANGMGVLLSKYIESVARQPELRPILMGQVLLSVGLLEAFPMIVLGIAMWFSLANPFLSAAKMILGG